MKFLVHRLSLFLLCCVVGCWCAELKAAEIPDGFKVKALVRQLGNEAFSVRQRAEAELREMGEPVEKLVRTFRNDPDPEIRRRVEAILDHLASSRRELKWVDPKLEGRKGYISGNSGRGVKLTFRNHLKKPVRIFWIDTEGKRQAWRGILKPGASAVCDRSYMGHVWLVADTDKNPLGIYKIDLDDPVIAVRMPVEAGRKE